MRLLRLSALPLVVLIHRGPCGAVGRAGGVGLDVRAELQWSGHAPAGNRRGALPHSRAELVRNRLVRFDDRRHGNLAGWNVWGVDMGGGENGLWRSTDEMQTWQLAWQASGWQTIEHVLPLASGAMIAVVVDSAGIRHIVRASDSSGSSFSSVTSLDFPSGARIHSAHSWAELNGTIYVAEYGDPAPPIVLWKSTDDGRTFSAVYSRIDARHYHAVQPDFHVDDVDHVPQSRVLTLMFTPDAVYWGTDTSATHVQTSPASPRLSRGTFFAFA